jgi:hypothetical protein
MNSSKFRIKHNACNDEISYEKNKKKRQCNSILKAKGATYALKFVFIDFFVLFSEIITISHSEIFD